MIIFNFVFLSNCAHLAQIDMPIFQFFSIIRRDIQLFWCFAGVDGTGKICFTSAFTVTLLSNAFSVLEIFTSVNDTAEEYLTDSNDTGKVILYNGVNETGKPTPKPSMAFGTEPILFQKLSDTKPI
jgi:hypothetical protein